MRLSISTPKRWLLLILAAYIILGIGYSIVIPLAETPDESEHFRYMQSIANSGELPVMLPVREENVTIEAHQPPLYYLVGATLFGYMDLDPADNPPDNPCFSFEPDDPGRKTAYLHNSEEWPPQRDLYRAFLMMRWLSVLMGAATVWLAYVIGRQAVPTLPWFAPAVAATLAFNPQFIFITASVNNDVPTTMLGAAIVALSVSSISRPRLGTYVLLGVIVGLGILSKFALFAFWPLAIIAAVWPALRITRSPFSLQLKFSGLIGRLLAVSVPPLLIAGWWYLRNYRLYGDPLMWDVTLAAKGPVIARTSPFTLSDLAEFVSLHFQSFWLWFGWLNIKAPDWVYGLFLLLCLGAAAGLVRWFLRRNIAVERPALVINALAILAIYASLLQYIQTINWTGYQGRLAFAAAASISLFITLGLAALGSRRLAAGTAAGLLVVAITALFLLLLPAYPRPTIYQPAEDLTRTCARFAEGLQIEAVDTGTVVRPGDSLPVTLYGYGLADAAGPQEITLVLRGADGQEVGQVFADLQWRAGEVVSSAVELPVAQDAIPARAVLDVALLDADGRNQSATSATGRLLDVPFSLEAVKIAPEETFAPVPLFETAANFGDLLVLIGYDVQWAESGPAVTLYWQAKETMAQDYTTFVHIVDGGGNLVAQSDGQPTNGIYPTSIWDEGEIVADRKELTLPADAPLEQLNMVTGVYLLETLQRLPVTDAAGQRQPGDQWRLDLPKP